MERVVLRGAAMLDGVGAAPVRGRTVVVENGRIAAVASDGPVRDGRVVDLGGLTLLPGLIDCHVHLCMGAEPDPARVTLGESLAATTIKVSVRAHRTVQAGITTVRDLGGRDYVELAVRDAVRAGLVPGPRILAAGKGICMTGGHGWWIGREADGPDDVRRAVREQLKAGADVIKILATGGVMTPGVEPGATQLTPVEIAAAIEEARKAGRRTAAHAMASDGIAACVEAGITTIEHGVFLTESLAARMARDGIALVPTLNAPCAITEGGLSAGIPEYMVRKSDVVRARHVESVQIALRAGVVVAAGTDAGTPLNPHGSLARELELLVKAGMAPADAVRAATSVAARVLGLESETGRIAPGLSADLLAVEGDPTERIQALEQVRVVLAQGRRIVDGTRG